MQRDPLSKSPVFGAFFLLGTALAACSGADGESSVSTQGTLAVEAWSTSGAVLDYTSQAPNPNTIEGEPTGDWVACEHQISPPSGAEPSLVVKASMPNYGSKDGFYFRLRARVQPIEDAACPRFHGSRPILDAASDPLGLVATNPDR